MAENSAMAQYAEAKRRHPDALLFFRMGDFYEMFHDDAKVAAEALGLTLTARDRERQIPMAGVPVRAADAYLRRLLERGHKVAVCEQIGDPATTKGVLDREVVRVLTPGTITEDDALDPRRSNYLLAIRPIVHRRRRDARHGVAWIDLSTGRFFATEVADDALDEDVARIQPAEVLVPEGETDPDLLERLQNASGVVPTFVPAFTLEARRAARRLGEHFRVAGLDGFGLGDLPAAQAAAGGVLAYLEETQRTALGHVSRIERRDRDDVLLLDRTTRRRLDLVQRADGSVDGTLVGVLDRTRTAMGGRLLRDWILAPLRDAEAIARRLDGVEEFVRDGALRRDLRDALAAVRDIERILGRVATRRASPRDVQALGRSLEALPALSGLTKNAYSATVADLRTRVGDFSPLAERIARALDDELPPTITDGGVIRAGWSGELDDLRALARGAKDWIAAYQAQEAARTGIPSLKIGFNRVFGYYLEVTNAHRDKVPAEYTRRQTLRHAERYVTPELAEWERKALHADDQGKALEQTLFLALRDDVAAHTRALQETADALAELDVLAALGDVAAAGSWTRPELLADRTLDIRDGRHPVVEASLTGGERFVPNDTNLDDQRRVALITGPNMAGKSTYIRQTGLIVLLAQMGSFVPATRARIGLADRLFARVGAEDDLARGQSTFMVEMSETAFILHHATARSVVLLDEVGRGTSTFDGIAIAWALTEYLSEVSGARTLFATHYHELTRLASELPSIVNLNVAVREWEDRIVFLRRIQEGATDRSYGIHVAELAGVPEAVVQRAKAVLLGLESDRDRVVERVAFGRAPRAPHDVQLALFVPEATHPAVAALREIDVDALTPLEALNRLAALRNLARE